MKARIGLMAVWIVFFACGENKKTSADGGWDITITGKVGFPQKGDSIHIYGVASGGTFGKVPIVLKDDYTFSHVLHLKEPGFYNLDFYGQQIVTVMLNKSNIEVNVDGNNRQGFSEVKGSPEYDFVKKVHTLQMEVQESPEIQRLVLAFNKASEKNDVATMQSLQAIYLDSLKKNNDRIAALFLAEPASIATVNLLGAGDVLDPEQYGNVFIDAAKKLKAEYPGAGFAKSFVEWADKMSALAIGSLAPEIAQPNPEGQVVKLSSLRGTYVLVDFWAKWCGPCRRENPNVVQAYKRFKDRGFTVFGVSLDRNHEDWVQAIRQDGLTWTHVSDFQSEVATTYNVSAIPFSILLDKKGVIIAKNLRGPALVKKLEEVIGK